MGLPTHLMWRESEIPVVKADRRWRVSMSRVVKISRSKYAEAHGRLFFDPEGKAYELTKDSTKAKPSLYLYVQQLDDYVPIVEVPMEAMVVDTFKRMKAREVIDGRSTK